MENNIKEQQLQSTPLGIKVSTVILLVEGYVGLIVFAYYLLFTISYPHGFNPLLLLIEGILLILFFSLIKSATAIRKLNKHKGLYLSIPIIILVIAGWSLWLALGLLLPAPNGVPIIGGYNVLHYWQARNENPAYYAQYTQDISMAINFFILRYWYLFIPPFVNVIILIYLWSIRKKVFVK